MQHVLDAIPFVAQAGIQLERADAGAGRVRLPFRAASTNHVGTLHAAALVLVAETAAGVAALTSPALQGYVLLAKGLTIRYRRPGTADVWGESTIPTEVAEATAARVEADGRSDLDVASRVLDADGVVLAEVTVTFHFRKR